MDSTENKKTNKNPKEEEKERIEKIKKKISEKKANGDISKEQEDFFNFILDSEEDKKDNYSKYDETISITISKEQKEFLETISDYHNMPKSETIRRYIDNDMKEWNNKYKKAKK